MSPNLTSTTKKGTIDSVNKTTYQIVITKKVKKQLQKLPKKVIHKFIVLAEQLRDAGPVVGNWKNYSKLGKNNYHCHLDYSYVACWTHKNKTILIEVYYVGSRENAPY